MSIINVDFEALTPSQQDIIKDAYGTHEYPCSGCAVYLGATPEAEHSYFLHYGVSDWYVSLPIADEGVTLNYEDGGSIDAGGRLFDLKGVEIIPPPFQLLVHYDTRKLQGEGSGGSIPPRTVAVALGLPVNKPVEWIGNMWLIPTELTPEILSAMVSIATVYPNGDRI